MNRLARESSPYLRQHAGNPVDWYPWGEEAFERARREDKPVFVSIGYASCHWCHVMAHESFEDAATAADLERDYVSVKVDREERPDVDAVYMAAVQAQTGSGGWPMSVFCTPDGRPFFAGTYFPTTDRRGMPSFRHVLEAVATAWSSRRADVEAQADALAGAVESEARLVDRLAEGAGGPAGAGGSAEAGGSEGATWSAVLGHLVASLRDRFDPVWGGFGPAPKFPRPSLVDLCLRHHGQTADEVSLRMATTTLDAMAAGGMYDHLEGGFARYSTDNEWMVPHFEKMLTDQALLARAYLHGWQATGSTAYLQVARETLDFVCEQLAADSGGLCSSIDADADGIEGSHATWTPGEVHEALSARGLEDLTAPFCDWYGITDAGNFEGRNVPHRPLGAPLDRPPDIETARLALLAARRLRPQPARDDKVLTEWNAMSAAVLAEAAGACGCAPWAERAERVANALCTQNRRHDGRWLRTSSDGRSAGASDGVLAFAADHAWLVECFVRLGELTGRAQWTELAAETAGAMLDLFWDEESGGLFTTGHDGDRLIVRGKDVIDGAVPSATSTAALALLRLAMVDGDDRWREAGQRLTTLIAPLLDRQPLAVADMVPAIALVEGGVEVVVAGERPDLLQEARRWWIPDAVLAWGEPTPSPLWEGRAPGAAYVCRRFVCHEPARDSGSLESQLVPLAVKARR